MRDSVGGTAIIDAFIRAYTRCALMQRKELHFATRSRKSRALPGNNELHSTPARSTITPGVRDTKRRTARLSRTIHCRFIAHRESVSARGRSRAGFGRIFYFLLFFFFRVPTQIEVSLAVFSRGENRRDIDRRRCLRGKR